jgi:prepilin-type N-terminal cleavage/methylation domain-containing protein
MNETRFISRRPTRRDGFTLIEVVIALAIFVFGALAIIRIFPPALGVIQNSGDQLVASNMNRSLLTKFESSPETLPAGIYDNDVDNGWRNQATGAVVGTRFRNNSLPPSITDFDGSALKRFRQVVGEQHKVQQLIAAGGNKPFVMANFSYTGEVLVYRERKVSGAIMDNTGLLDMSNAKFEDGSNFVQAPGDLVYASYSWLENAGDLNDTNTTHFRIQSASNELCVTPATNRADTLTPTTVLPARNVSARTRGKQVVGGEVAVKCRQYLGYVPPSATKINAQTGLVNLSALANTNPVTFPTNVTTVSLDYTVSDWGDLIKDAPLDAVPDETQINRAQDPIPTNYRGVNLPIRLLDDEKNPSFYALILAPDPTQNVREAVGLLGSTGITENSVDIVTAFSAIPPTNPVMPPPIPENKKGQIFFRVPNLASSYKVTPQVRVAYRTLDNWVQQPSVAAQSYIPVYATGTGAGVTDVIEYWRSYYVGRQPASGVNPSQTDGYLYFKPSEAGKTVVVTYSIGNPAATPDTDNTISRVLTIDPNIIDCPNTVASDFARSPYAGSPLAPANQARYVSRLQLTDTAGNPLASRLTAIQDVRGISIQSRTAWLDGSRFSQTASTGFRKGSEQ